MTFCTEMGCPGGLSVDFVEQPTARLRVEAHAPGSNGVYVIDCEEANRRCQGGVHFGDFTPETVQIRFISAADTFVQQFRPVYANLRPNGPDCPPLYCLRGRVRVELPSAW